MTFIEKYKEDHAVGGLSERRVITEFCPSEFGYESDSDGLCTEDATRPGIHCGDCWNRQVPEGKG